MAKIPDPQHTIASAIDAAHEANQGLPRAHMGASVIGHECDRYIWLSFRWAVVEQFPGRVLRLFRRGQLEENTVHEDLRMIGCQISTINPETRRQWSFADGHFGGSCDGVITSGLPGAAKTVHVLEIKTHSKKSFDDLVKHGVHKSKPQHWAQMQVYMAAFGIDRALYYAVCKDDDRIHTERIEHDPQASQALMDRAQRLIASDRMPEPLSADPTWYACKYCSAHDLCHGSKLTRQVSCRTCAHSTAERDGRWTCAHWECDIPDAEAQRTGCDAHIIHPDLTPWQYEPAEQGVIWLTPHGRIHNAPTEYLSSEIIYNPEMCAAKDPFVERLRAEFGGRVVG